jgi:hypothetical protein
MRFQSCLACHGLMGLLDKTDLIYVNTRLAGTRHRPRSSRCRIPAAAASQTVNRTPPNTVQRLGYFFEGGLLRSCRRTQRCGCQTTVRSGTDSRHLSVGVYAMFACLAQTFSRWGIRYGVSPMSSLERRLAAVTSRTADLIAQLIELNRLRDRLRKAQLAWRSRRIERRQKPRR